MQKCELLYYVTSSALLLLATSREESSGLYFFYCWFCHCQPTLLSAAVYSRVCLSLVFFRTLFFLFWTLMQRWPIHYLRKVGERAVQRNFPIGFLFFFYSCCVNARVCFVTLSTYFDEVRSDKWWILSIPLAFLSLCLLFLDSFLCHHPYATFQKCDDNERSPLKKKKKGSRAGSNCSDTLWKY